MEDEFYRSKDPTNSIKVLKENLESQVNHCVKFDVEYLGNR